MPQWNVQDQLASLAISLIMLPQTAPDFPGLNPNQRILAGIESGPFSEGLRANEKLVNLVRPVLEVIIADQFQKALQFGSTAKLRGFEDALNFRSPLLYGRRGICNASSGISSLS